MKRGLGATDVVNLLLPGTLLIKLRWSMRHILTPESPRVDAGVGEVVVKAAAS